MDINTDNEKRIDAYIKDNSKCNLEFTEPVLIQDMRVDVPVFRLPLSLIYYNIKNGRFAAEYKDLVDREQRPLDPSSPEDAEKIENLLLDQDANQTKILTEDLKRFGQKDPGIITWDGFVINGNRRMAILSRLSKGGKDEWAYLNVARLPKNVNEKDLWKIEAGIQLSRQEKLDYGPINTLLKFKEGKQAGLSEAQIASSLYGGYTEDFIKESLKRLELIELWLEYVGETGNYKKAEKERIHEHFIDLQDILADLKEDGLSADELEKIQSIAFELIRQKIPHLDIRKIKKLMGQERAKSNFFTAVEHVPQTIQKQSSEAKKDEEDEEDEEEESSQGQYSIVKTIFYDSVDIQKAAAEKDKPDELLKRAIANLTPIDMTSPKLKEPATKEKIRKVVEIVENLKAIIERN